MFKYLIYYTQPGELSKHPAAPLNNPAGMFYFGTKPSMAQAQTAISEAIKNPANAGRTFFVFEERLAEVYRITA